MVGTSGLILKTIDGSTNWTKQSSGTTENLEDVHFANLLVGCAVGDAGTILRTTDGGMTWLPQTSIATEVLNSVYLVDEKIGYIVGGYGKILKTTDGGATWLNQSVSIFTNWINSIYFTSPTTGYAVGEYGTILSTYRSGTNIVITPKPNLTYQLYPNYPNPFNPSTTIEYLLPKTSHVELKIYNVLGQEVQNLVNELQESGRYEVHFERQGLPTGLYFYSLRAGEFCETKKMLIVK